MPQQPEYEIDFPCLLVAICWAERHCIVPDGFRKGEPWSYVKWQEWCIANAYRVKPTARVGQLSTAFHWRRSQIVLPQKAGKAPYTATRICIEAVGPALFAGWARGGETWDCRDHGCGCGWVYEYQPGEAMGMRWPTPVIQITATSEDQTGNIYTALRPMIDDGPLHDLIPRTGEEFIRLPGDGRIDPVTANATSRVGQRVTFVPHDETGFYWKSNGMIEVCRAQRRGATAMGGRTEETTNAWDPTQDSIAQRTERSKSTDIFRHHPLAPKGLSYANKAERRRIHAFVYEGCPWIDLDAIEGDAAEALEEDPAEAERFYGNRMVAGGGPAFNFGRWEAARKPREVPVNAAITIGVDGAKHDDALAVVACEAQTGYVWPLAVIERPDNLTREQGEFYEHDQSIAEGAIREAFERYQVWRVYCDPQHIKDLMTVLQNEFGERRVIKWETYRPRPIAWAVRNFVNAVKDGDVSHPGDGVLDRHVGNARKKMLTVLDDKERPMFTLGKDSWRSPRKIDAAMAAVLAWEARGDAIAAGLHMGDTPDLAPTEPEPYRWTPGEAIPAQFLHEPIASGPMGSMS